MKLRRLDILGFKSFRTKTGLEIHDGVTTVVGPNGCGKSNIVDAIRWAIGSQSPKDLRGRAMDDVIFAGSEHHKPLGFAEVSLTLENDGRDVPVEWREHAEIKVTRRLFRSGESEYEINGSRVRLRDVHQLFLGTGVGAKEAYSIIEQGRIGFIVSARPEERRVLIEEAAGITRYKFQRQSAQRRLEKTRENLVRVQDVLSEVERQLSALQRQARRAARWRELSDEKFQLEVRAALDKRDRAAASAASIELRLQAARERAEITRATLTGAEARTEAQRAQAQLEEHVLNEATEAAYQARARRDLLENTLRHQQREREALAERRERLDERARSESGVLERAQDELARTVEASRTAAGEAEQLAADVRASGAELEEARRLEAEVSRAVEAAVAASSRARGALAEVRARVESAAAERAALGERISGASARLEQAESQRAARAAEAVSATAAAAAALAALEEARAAADAAAAAETAERDRADGSRKALRDGTAAADAAAARVRALEGVAARGEGYTKGVRRALAAVAAGELAGVGRPVAERLRVESGDERRLAAALGPYADALVADSANAARTFAEWATRTGVSAAVCWGDEAAITGPVADWVRAAEPVPAAVGVRVRAARFDADVFEPGRGAGAADEVALSDDLSFARVAPCLVVVGGVGTDAASVIGLASDLERARQGEQEARGRLEALRASLDVAEAALAAAGSARELARRRVADAEGMERQARRASDEAERVAAACARARDDAELERRRLVERDEALARASVDEAERVRECEQAAERAAAEVDAAQARLPELRARAAEVADRNAEIRARAARSSERAEGLGAARRRLEETIENATRQRAESSRELAEVSARAEAIDETLGADRRAFQASVEAAEAADLAMEKARARHDGVVAQVRELEAGLHAARKAHNEGAEALREVELGAERARNDVEHAEAGLIERYQLTVAAARELAGGRPFSDADRAALRDVEDKLARLGPVNPSAEDEYSEANERYEFLSTQKADLEAAMADLEAAVKRMDKTSRELFAQTFAAVDERFRELFPKLFQGGKARLEMTEPDDLLQTGIDVVVQPPGKRLQSMTLLSGGAKALAAVALIFSIFQLKPTPFCILDEVDAPLDEANVTRFAETVRTMSATSQFLIITHNKRTMEVAGTLYGVTMEEPGVSKVVGVRMSGRADESEPVSAA